MGLLLITFAILTFFETVLFFIYKNKLNSWAYNMNKNFNGEKWFIISFALCLNILLGTIVCIINFLVLLFNIFN